MSRRAALLVAALALVSLATAAPLLSQADNPASRALLGATGEQTPEPVAGTPEPRVGPVESVYFRSMAYDRYTGERWVRTGALRPYPRGLPPANGTGVAMELRVESPVQTLPVPWRPTYVGGPVNDTTRVSDLGLVPGEELTPGTRVVVGAHRPAWTEASLRSAGTDYPDAVAERYTQVPDGTPTRVDDLAANVTSDAETPYETAVAVERWLETEKNYSLGAARPPGRFVDGFLFEQDRGYCQYFASAMVVMLRSEGVPARYVSGYKPTAPTGPGEYTVRGKDAHAWVEVYFPGTGWVAFDPTPAAARAAARGQSAALASSAARGQSAALASRAARGQSAALASRAAREQSAALASRAARGQSAALASRAAREQSAALASRAARDATDPSTTSRSALDSAPRFWSNTAAIDPEYRQVDANVSVDGEVVPGNEVTVTVSRDGRPLPRLQVRFNDTPVGTTNLSGQVTAEVPYAESLSITAHEAVDGAATATPGGTVTGGDGAGTGVGTPAPTSRQPGTVQDLRFSGERVSLGGPIGSLSGDVLFTVVVFQGVGEFPGGRAVTTERPALAQPPRTTAHASLPTARPENATFPLNTTVTVEVPDPLRPGESTVDARIEGVPVADARVVVGDREYRTDAGGRATVAVPFREQVRIRVERGAASANRTYDVSLGEGRVELPDAPAPGTTVTARAFAGDVPLDGAVVRVNGERVGRAEDGRLAIRVPYADSLTVTARLDAVNGTATRPLPTGLRVRVDRAPPGGRTTARVTLDGRPVENATVAVGGETYRTGPDGRVTVLLPYALSAAVVAEKGTTSGRTGVGMGRYWLGGLGVVAFAGAVLVRRTALDLPRNPLALARLTVALVVLTVAGLLRALTSRLPSGSTQPAEPTTTNEGPGVPEAAPDDHALYRAWARLARLAGADRTATPADVARRAAEAGLPEDTVSEVTERFREVRYGGAPPGDEGAAREALDRLEGDER